jgi:integrase
MVESILDKHEFEDGRIVLYRRGDIADNSNYTVRLRIPKASGYVIRSTGTADLFQARRFAAELYDHVRLKVMNGESLRDHPFDKCAEDYKEDLDTQTFKTEKERKEVKAYFDNYPVRFFESKPLAKIGDQEILDFIDWRMKNPIRRESVQVNSVRAELNTLKKFFLWAKRKKIITALPDFKKPKAGKNRRPHFDARDWNKLAQHLRKFAKHENKSTQRDRVMLWSYVLILANTGIRIGEARDLKWRDIREINPPKGANEPPNIALYVRGKTGAREVVARTPDIKKYFARILELRRTELMGKEPDLESLVFCHADGKPIQSFKKSFNALVKSAGVEKDTHGHRRTIYSLRHTYATFRLMEGVHQFVLARNMGTSVAMLESFYGHTSNIAAAQELTKNSGYNSAAKTRALKWIEE